MVRHDISVTELLPANGNTYTITSSKQEQKSNDSVSSRFMPILCFLVMPPTPQAQPHKSLSIPAWPVIQTHVWETPVL